MDEGSYTTQDTTMTTQQIALKALIDAQQARINKAGSLAAKAAAREINNNLWHQKLQGQK